MKRLLTLLLILSFSTAFAAKPRDHYVKIVTSKGTCIIRLYNETPLHRDNFLKLTREGFYNGTLFHRVIKSFMIQGGDPDSKTAPPGVALGEGDLKYTVPAEFRKELFHKKGALAAARDNNPEKASSAAQFYLVHGKVFTDSMLNVTETNRLKFKLPEAHRQVYKTMGGAPHLDQNYTVYGEVVQGMEMIDNVAEAPKGKGDRPVEDIRMTVTELKKGAVRKLLKDLKKQAKTALISKTI